MARIATCARILAISVLITGVGSLVLLRTTPAQTPDQYLTPDQYQTPYQYQTPTQPQTAPGEDPGGYYASSYPTADLIYCASNPQWQSLSKKYLQHFDTLEEAQAAYPNRQLRC